MPDLIAAIRPRILAAALLLLPATGAAQVVGDPDVVSLLMMDHGLAVVASTDADGAPELQSQMDGLRFRVLFYGCDPQPCDVIQFSAGFAVRRPVSAARINRWNRERLFGKAFADPNGDPFVEMDVNLYGDGVGRRNFEDSLELWRQVLNDFRDHIDW